MICNDTYRNILVSYAYAGNNPSFADILVNLSRQNRINVMIDSGAFTKFNAQNDMRHINIDGYCNFLADVGNFVHKYVMLDVVGNAMASKRNYELMVSKGLSPMFVMTMFDDDYDFMNETLSVNRNVCVAGGVTTKGPWMIRRFQQIYKRSGGKALMHGLGFVKFPEMLQLNLASTDSSTWWTAPQRFGSIKYFDNAMKAVSIADIKKGKISPVLSQIFNLCNVNPSDILDSGKIRGGCNIQSFVTTVGYVLLQKYCYKRGLRCFMAATSKSQLLKYLYVCDNLSQLNYNEYRKI